MKHINWFRKLVVLVMLAIFLGLLSPQWGLAQNEKEYFEQRQLDPSLLEHLLVGGGERI